MIVLIDKEKLLKDMKNNGFNTTSLAKETGYSKAYISSIINHIRNPNAKVCVKICELLRAQFGNYFFIESVHKEKQNK